MTGALVFTGTHFAEILEGPEDGVEALMRSIVCDSRHHDVDIVEKGPVDSRRFSDWSLAYSGPAYFIDRHIVPLIEAGPGSERRLATAKLIGLMQEFARQRSRQR